MGLFQPQFCFFWFFHSFFQLDFRSHRERYKYDTRIRIARKKERKKKKEKFIR